MTELLLSRRPQAGELGPQLVDDRLQLGHLRICGGFVGRAVAERLAQAGLVVTALHRREPTDRPRHPMITVVADLLDRERIHAIAQAGQFDVVCHLAGLTNGRDSLQQPLRYFDVNVGGTIGLLQACEGARVEGDHPLRFVFASTHAVYGNPDTAEPLIEIFELDQGRSAKLTRRSTGARRILLAR